MVYCGACTVNGDSCKNGVNCHLHSSNPDKCSICLNSVRPTRGVRKLDCGHLFHVRCLNEWKGTGTRTCPLCRKPFDTKKYKVTMTILNTETSESRITSMDSTIIQTILQNMNLNDDSFLLEEFETNIEFDVETRRELENILADLGVSNTNTDILIPDAE